MSDPLVQALFYGLLLVLSLSSLAARREPVATVMRYAIAWIVIFGVGLLVVQTVM